VRQWMRLPLLSLAGRGGEEGERSVATSSSCQRCKRRHDAPLPLLELTTEVVVVSALDGVLAASGFLSQGAFP
jgi:hypothetical protein